MRIRRIERIRLILSRVATNFSMETRLWPKMQEDAHFQIGRAKVVEQLTSSVFGQFRACFGFYHNLLVDDHVYALYAKLLSFVDDSGPYLARHAMATSQKLTLQRHHIEVFEKSISEIVVNLEKSPDHRSCECLFQQA